MGKKMTWEEIKQQYNQEWVELVDVDWPDEESSPRGGVVRVHDKDHDELYRKVMELEPVDSAVVFVGKPDLPPNVVIGSRHLITIFPADA